MAEYTLFVYFFGYDYITSAAQTDPIQSKQKIIEHLQKRLPDTTEKQIPKRINA